MSEFQTMINLAAGCAFSAIGWFAREMYSAVNELKRDLSKLREDLPKNYIDRTDYRSDVREMKEMLGKIFDKLDGKVDK